MKIRTLFLALCMVFFCLQPSWARPLSYDDPHTDQYDSLIERFSRRWLPDIDWIWWKAQLYQESGMDTNAKSGVGAEGICQAMGPTWEDWIKENGWGNVSRHEARYCIEGGARYMSQLRTFWQKRGMVMPSDLEHAQGSYNAGAGNIDKAWRLAGKLPRWAPTATALVRVTGKANAKQTSDYIVRIRGHYMHFSAKATR